MAGIHQRSNLVQALRSGIGSALSGTLTRRHQRAGLLVVQDVPTVRAGKFSWGLMISSQSFLKSPPRHTAGIQPQLQHIRVRKETGNALRDIYMQQSLMIGAMGLVARIATGRKYLLVSMIC